MSLTDLVNRVFLAGALATASVGAGAVVISVPAVAEAKQLEELTPANFAKKVYHNPKPVVVLFYEAETDLKNDGSLEYSRRMEQVVEALADKYDNQVAFFRVAIDHHVFQKKGDYAQKFGVSDTVPLTVMYGRFDLLTGQQALNNFKIDVWEGGPVDEQWISNWIKIGNGWIDCNLVGACSREAFAYRFKNGAQIHKVYK